MRDENGFKQHTLSEAHVRNMQLIGEDPKKFIKQYSNDFRRDFLQLLRTAHGEKAIHLNRFYQEYIANKSHVHLNATQWNSLTEFAKMLGREGIVRVTEEEDKGLHIAWIDNSPDALRRQDAVRKKERQDRGDEEREKKAIREQVERAHQGMLEDDSEKEHVSKHILERKEGEKISLKFGAKKEETPLKEPESAIAPDTEGVSSSLNPDQPPAITTTNTAEPSKIKMSFGTGSSKPKNVFAAAKKNPLNAKKAIVPEPARKISEAERIMNEEKEQKRRKEEQGGGGKRIRMGNGLT